MIRVLEVGGVDAVQALFPAGVSHWGIPSQTNEESPARIRAGLSASLCVKCGRRQRGLAPKLRQQPDLHGMNRFHAGDGLPVRGVERRSRAEPRRASAPKARLLHFTD
jgi:hypothetical protein